jgi:hypothetical protein
MFGGYTGLSDMVNGGGAGASGDTFKGGPYSGLLNAVGVRPMGYAARQESVSSGRPRPRPAQMQQSMPMPMQQPMQQPASVMPPVMPAPPTTDHMLMLMNAIKSAPQPQQGMSREQLVNMMRAYY